jgi:hypothetical protein
MKEERFAILIGMNNYKDNPLDFSVKDATDLKDVLVSHCRFKKGNITMIVDSNIPVKEQIDNAYHSIAEKLKPQIDLFLLYFSGHGDYDKDLEKSNLILEDDSEISISEIVFNYLEPLKAKNQYLIIDACHSGKPFYIKPKYNQKKRERKLLNDSKEIYFLFAAEEHKKAFQTDKLKNSYYTYYFIECIKNTKLYDEDGWLTMSSIDENVRKKLSSHKDVVQIPGSESRATGYKPFAFLSTKMEDILPVTIENIEIMNTNSNEFNLEQSLTTENRQFIQDHLSQLLQKVVIDFDLKEFEAEYEIAMNGNILDGELAKSLEERIIQKAQHEDLAAINGVFNREVIRHKRNKTGLTGMIDMLYGEPEPVVYYRIRHIDSVVCSTFILFKAKSFSDVSGGLYVLFYQAKYGFVFCKTYFKYEWDGTLEKISNFVNVELTPYLLQESSILAVKSELNNSLIQLSKHIRNWSGERKKEISKFLSRAKK